MRALLPVRPVRPPLPNTPLEPKSRMPPPRSRMPVTLTLPLVRVKVPRSVKVKLPSRLSVPALWVIVPALFQLSDAL